jgi:hypothetical protein
MTSASSANDKNFAGDSIPPKCAVIEVHVGELKQLFDAIDPSPFRERDLDPKAEEFIVGWAKDLPREASLALVVNLDREAGLPDEAAVLRDAIHEFFRHRAETQRQRLRELLRVGRTSLARLSDRLATMPIRIRYANATGPEAWRADWPAVSPIGQRNTIEAQQGPLNLAS